MEYLVGEKKYHLSYVELKEKHYELCNIEDDKFMDRIPEALHLACVIAYLKELPNECTVSDQGIIHELVHLIHLAPTPYGIKMVRQQFENILRLD